jgi:chromosome segregation ATPase
MDYGMAIEELKRRADGTDRAIERLDERVTRHDEIIAVLSESIATKDDIAGLREDLRAREALHERLDTYRDRLADMEAEEEDRKSDRKHAEGMRVNWLMVSMFTGELLIGGATLYLMLRHV